MKQRHRLRLLAAALFCAVPLTAPAQTVRLSGPAVPQPPRVSHVPIPSGIEPGLADQFLQDRFQQAETAAQVERVLTNLVEHPQKFDISKEDQAILRKARERAADHPERMLQDPQVRRIISEAAAKQDRLPELTPEQRARLEEYARQLHPPSGPLPLGPDDLPPQPGKPLHPPPGKPAEPGKPPEGGNPPPPAGSRGPGVAPVMPPQLPPPPPPKSPLQERFRDLAESLADKGLADSPAFRRMLTNLDRVQTPPASDVNRWEQKLKGVEERLARAGTRLPKGSWPKMNFSPRGLGGRLRRAYGAAEEGTGDAPASPLLWVVAAAAVALVAWGLLRRRGLLALGGTGGAAPLGPWPVRPEAVSTREDLVRAFEYLALLRLGQAARSRNHREIAAGLGADDAARRTAADRLADLYEQARYAPPDEALPDAELAAARADLSLLAGAAVA